MECLFSEAFVNIAAPSALAFVAGTASGPMDIPDSILSAGAASAETASYLRRANNEK